MNVVTRPVRVFAKLGIHYLIVTNAAGGIKEDLNPGTIALELPIIFPICALPHSEARTWMNLGHVSKT